MNIKKIFLSSVLAASISPAIVLADIIDMTFDGLFTLSNGGVPIFNSDSAGNADFGNRTNISGTATLNTDTGNSTVTIAPIDFSGLGPMTFSNIYVQSIGDGFGSPGSLTILDLDANWNGSTFQMAGIMNASGLFSNLSLGAGATIGTGCASCAPSLTPNWSAGPLTGIIGPNPWVMEAYTVNYNTTRSNRGSIAPPPISNLGLGSPMISGPFSGAVPGFDFTSVTLQSITTTSAVPVPAAVWLFSCGLVGLVSVARHTEHKNSKN